MYHVAAKVSFISPGVGPELTRRGVDPSKLAYTPMWADESLFGPAGLPMRAELGLEADQIVLLYAGSIGEAQRLETLVDACAQVRDQRFVAIIAGSGTAEQSLRQRAAHLDARNVRFVGRIEPALMSRLLASADVAYISLNEHPLAKMTMPSKTQATLAAGRPLLVSGEGDVANVVSSSGAGWSVPSGDVQALRDAIESICGQGGDELRVRASMARQYYERTFSVAAGVDRIENLLSAIATERADHDRV